jgi:hypothetical protein
MRWMLVALVAGGLGLMAAIVRGWARQRRQDHAIVSDQWLALHRDRRAGGRL